MGDPGACAGPDCDDADRQLHDTGERTCFPSERGAVGVGVCRAGVATCSSGVFGPCIGAVVPSGEACNGLDDDCDGEADEALSTSRCGLGACAATPAVCIDGHLTACTPGAPLSEDDTTCDGVDDNCNGAIDEGCACVKVTQSGSDSQALSDNNASAFGTIAAAIAYASGAPGRPHNVCLANGATCNSQPASFQGVVVMANGISVLGGYEAASYTRCNGAVTFVKTGTPEGVVFPAEVTSPTVIDGLQIERASGSTAAGITIRGATGAIVSNVRISNTPGATTSYGVNVLDGGRALITKSFITAGAGTSEAIGVRVVGGQVTLLDNCSTLNDGRCAQGCCPSCLGIRGKAGPSSVGESYAVLLDDAAGSFLGSSAVCGNAGSVGAAVRVRGASDGVTLRGNIIDGSGAHRDSHGVWAEACGGASPWLVDNTSISAQGNDAGARVNGVRAVGACHPVIDANLKISGSSEGAVAQATGVWCGPDDAGVSSQCLVVNNVSIVGSSQGFPPSSTGLHCGPGSCTRVERNTITGRGGVDVVGLSLEQTGALVDANDISGGCASHHVTGIATRDAYARIQNNRVTAYRSCPVSGTAPTAQRFTALTVTTGSGANELDVHSNTFDGASQSSNACTAVAVALEAGARGQARGVFRNNIVRAGQCGVRVPIAETSSAADPRVFENNDLDPSGQPTALYLDEGDAGLQTLDEVNALVGAAANQSADPGFVAYPTDLHLVPSSPCVGAGTPAGAPQTDIDGHPRPSPPSIGVDEP
ncbi:MAG: hypothetical protein JNG84_08345 [Archangium sp.]|nr:hypothetical protein [Archangium sp.]